MKMTDILKKYVLPNLPYLIFLWFFAKAVSYTHLDVYKRQVYAVGSIL